MIREDQVDILVELTGHTVNNKLGMMAPWLALADEKCRNCTGLQLPGLLDELFSYNGPLGALFSEEAVSLYLWAPTAQSVCAYIYKHQGDDPIEIVPLEEEMVYGELMVQKVGMVVTTFIKYAYTTLVLHVLKNDMLMIL
ncbi:putative UDP-N-acetylglucosamine--peptide N-acetylglucosaminyltransferase SPINDLY [Trifolium repens]|nr:putative UDP-N-acetylglucosamine--peptide N-acetylglucosaminyltransferase SPINDLY [Trifolium repens]